MKFNINNKIKVKLKEDGYKHLAKLHNEMLGVIPNWERRDANYYASKADKCGYTEFQLWKFIKDFGEVTGLGLDNYYHTEIIIEHSDLYE